MISFSEFINKWNGKGIDFDGAYGVQCMDLYQQYNKEVVGGPHVPADPAYKVWAENKYPTAFYYKIENTPTNVPQKGDVIIWKPGLNGGFGHIAVFDNGNVSIFTSFDQNFQIKNAHLQSHNYNYVYGWLRPKIQSSPEDQKIAKIDTIVHSATTSTDKLAQIKQIV